MRFSIIAGLAALAAGVFAAPTDSSSFNCAAKCNAQYNAKLSADITASITKSDQYCTKFKGYGSKSSYNGLDQDLVAALEIRGQLLVYQIDACAIARDLQAIVDALARLEVALLTLQPCFTAYVKDFGVALNQLSYDTIGSFVKSGSLFIGLFGKYGNSAALTQLYGAFNNQLVKMWTLFFAGSAKYIALMNDKTTCQRYYSMLTSFQPICPGAAGPLLTVAIGTAHARLVTLGGKLMARGLSVVFE